MYKKGFDADWRDAYPGVNLVTLAELGGKTDLIKKYLPLVQFAAEQKLDDPNYWDLATLAELKVIEGDYSESSNYLRKAVTKVAKSEKWMIKTTLNNFKLIYEERQKRGENTKALEQLMDAMKKMI